MLSGTRWGSVGAKIIVWAFVPMAIVPSAVALVTHVAWQQVTEALVIQRAQNLTRVSAGQLAPELAECPDLLAALARTADIHGSDPIAQRGSPERRQSFGALWRRGSP